MDRPLQGKRILVTRAGAQARELVRRIEALGGEAIEFPTIEIQPPGDCSEFDAAIGKIEGYDWVIFTSVNTVTPFLGRLSAAGKTVASLRGCKIIAIGSETAKKLRSAEIQADLVPKRYQAEGILEELTPDRMKNQRVLLPRAAGAREVLPETLRSWGATVDVVVAYRTVAPEADIRPLASLLREGAVDVMTFTSSSTVKNFVHLFGDRRLSEIAGRSVIACIGPITAQTVTRLGGRADIVAAEFTIAGLMRAITDYFAPRSSAPAKTSGAAS